MTIYKCPNCPYKTTDKRAYVRHTERKIPCYMTNTKSTTHGNMSNNIVAEPYCELCGKNFATKDSLKKHTKSHHYTINNNKLFKPIVHNPVSNKYIVGSDNNMSITGNNNTLVIGKNNKIDNSTTIHQLTYNVNVTNHITKNSTNIHPYYSYKLPDLTLFEQYCILTDKESPYIGILDHFNLNTNKSQYHNMYLPDIKKNEMDVHTGKKWIKATLNNAINKIFDSQKSLMEVLFSRFRIFLNTDTMKAACIYYGCATKNSYRREINACIKLHLYNNRNPDEIDEIDTNVPDDNSKVFWAISKNFRWSEVCKIIRAIDDIDIDLNKNLTDIEKQLNGSNIAKIIGRKLYTKLTKRINSLILAFKNNNESDSDTISSTSDDSCSDSCDSCSDSCSDSCDSCSDSGSDNSGNNKYDYDEYSEEY